MDMGRTVVTVLGNCVACVVIARWDGEFQTEHIEKIGKNA
jgi:proton glutamate symport protein